MKAAIFERLGDPEVIKFVEQRPTKPGPNEVLIDIKAMGLNRAEYLFMRGEYLVTPQFPSRIGIEGAGIIAGVGNDVDNLSVGDRVAIFPSIDMTQYGVIGEQAVVPSYSVIPTPEGVSHKYAAAFWMAYGTAYGGLVQSGGLTEGSNQVVVISAASSSVGLAAIDLARHHSAQVIATTTSADKVDALYEQGADHVINVREKSVVEELRRITNGRGFDIAFDPVNGAFLTDLVNAGAKDAVVVEYGMLASELDQFPFFAMLVNSIAIKTFHLGFDLAQRPEKFAEAKDYLLDMLRRRSPRMLIDTTFDLCDVSDAYYRLASNQQLGKIVVLNGSE